MNRILNQIEYFRQLRQLEANGLFKEPYLYIKIGKSSSTRKMTGWKIKSTLYMEGFGKIEIREVAVLEYEDVAVINESSYHCEPDLKNNGLQVFRVDWKYGQSMPHINTSNPLDHLTESDTGLLISQINTVSAIRMSMAYLKTDVYPLDDVDMYNRIITAGRI